MGKGRPPFDINLTSPAASMALGLMYLRTERQDIADVLTIPDTVVSLNRIQPSFLMMRTLARALIMWNTIAPTKAWVDSQLPATVHQAIINKNQKGYVVDDALELAYYNILSACCFAVGLKYAGTASQDAYLLIVSFFDSYSRVVYSNGDDSHPLHSAHHSCNHQGPTFTIRSSELPSVTASI
jgi:anaphase-promoting complex subunit 1